MASAMECDRMTEWLLTSAPSNYNAIGNSGNWINFETVTEVSIIGGTLDGQWAKLGSRDCPFGSSQGNLSSHREQSTEFSRAVDQQFIQEFSTASGSFGTVAGHSRSMGSQPVPKRSLLFFEDRKPRSISVRIESSRHAYKNIEIERSPTGKVVTLEIPKECSLYNS
ncbi:Uncharacterized protein Fot_36237 [Forsythia ovata]|uniref:Uncharacterized protein n=1 Tax=Forsythia ovata TaxID=205694 RepID=A0ABD1SRH9_9LAMI